MENAGTPDRIVLIVDDDRRVCEALETLLAAHHLTAVSFGSVEAYTRYSRPDVPACLILDLDLPTVSGLEFQQQLGDRYHPPIIFITGHGDIPSSVRAIKAGALDFLTKPFSAEAVIAAIDTGIARDRQVREDDVVRAALRDRHASLTPREKQVLPLVVSGLLNKQAAAQLGISEVTLQIHRSRIMHKMAAQSFADLVRMSGQLDIAGPVPLRR
jgi:FixJ family two-component response regulator